jgi:hypothetical protein
MNNSLFNRNIRLFFFSGKYAFATVFEKHVEFFCRMAHDVLRIYVSGVRRVPVVRILLKVFLVTGRHEQSAFWVFRFAVCYGPVLHMNLLKKKKKRK